MSDFETSNKLEKILLRGGRECAHRRRGGVAKMVQQREEGVGVHNVPTH